MSKKKSETNEEKRKTKRLKKEKSVNKAKVEMINKIVDKIKTLFEESEDREDELTGLEIKLTQFFSLF